MLHYVFYQKNPASHYIYIDLHISGLDGSSVQLHLPAWRPGRYELGNFAKNIKRFEAWSQENEPLTFTKLNKDVWEIELRGNKSIKVTYSYYAAELNAGSCYADESQLYVNPVHCCFFVKGMTESRHTVELKIPAEFSVATSLKRESDTLVASCFDELADSPFIASAEIQTDHYDVGGTRFYLHFNGECMPDFTKIKKHFSDFTAHMVKFWGDFPVAEYHFLFQVVPYKFYHGVEHSKSTVIALGPGYAINDAATYEDLLGVSCHELFHTWNVKAIRPVEMQPYDFSRENYARTGFVYEGFTTYYGDKLLLGSGVFNLQQYFKTLEERLQKHFHNYGRYNMGVADSSWDTWLDGYVPGAPYRKTNIYDEGSLVALMLDVKIMEATRNTRSLRDVCVLMYERYGKTGKGYTEEDVKNIVNEVAGNDLSAIFKNFVYAANDFEPGLAECFSYLGIEMVKQHSPFFCEHHYGFKTADAGQHQKVTLVAPYSPAWKAGLFAGDEIIAVNNHVAGADLNHWLQYFSQNGEVSLTVNSARQLKNLRLTPDKKGSTYFFQPTLKMKNESSMNGNPNFVAWMQN
jgi:predicted metalloprotease with PDZ domain